MSKFKKLMVIVAVVIVFTAVFAAQSYADSNQIGTVTGDSLNVREEPNTSAKVLTQLSKGEQVLIISSSNGWHRISYDNIKGWVSGDFISIKKVDAIGKGVVNASSLNLRENPDTSATVLTQIPRGAEVEILGSSDDWYNVSYKNTKGWVFAEFITVKDTAIGSGTINADSVNVRSNPGTSSDILTRLDTGEGVSVLVRSGDWYRIKASDGTIGWVYKDFVTMKTASNASTSRGVENLAPKEEDKNEEAESKEESNLGKQIVEYARKFLGVKYVWGGSSPKGFDCSGFSSYVYSNFGIKIERVAADQAKQGTKIKKSELKAGDLVFFDTNGGSNHINHVGIYIGKGQFIHASSGRNSKKVVISDLSSGFYASNYMTARRFIK